MSRTVWDYCTRALTKRFGAEGGGGEKLLTLHVTDLNSGVRMWLCVIAGMVSYHKQDLPASTKNIVRTDSRGSFRLAFLLVLDKACSPWIHWASELDGSEFLFLEENRLLLWMGLHIHMRCISE